MKLRSIAPAAFVVALVLGACSDAGGEQDPIVTTSEAAATVDAATADFVLEFVDGVLVGGFRRESVTLGDPIKVLITGGLDERIHLHGYDVFVAPTTEDVVLEFDALIPGRFELELEESSELLIQLTVS